MHGEGKGRSYAPPTYEIRVAGALDRTWSDALEGMAVNYGPGAEGRRVTILTGALDQAALAGVLDTLFGLSLTVLSVQVFSTGH